MDEMYEIVQQAKCKILGVDEMCQIGWFIAKFDYEYSSIFVVSVVKV